MRDRPVATTDFDEFVANVQGRVRRALTPVAGAEAARQATADALVVVWGDWQRVRAMRNPSGYVYTVARNRLRRRPPPPEALPDDLASPMSHDWAFEPQLIPCLAALPERQRVAVYLVHGCGWPVPEVAALLGISVSTVRVHAERGLQRLRRELRGGAR
jgi:RNA polymerase sigma factor (sigma-70 family)